MVTHHIYIHEDICTYNELISRCWIVLCVIKVLVNEERIPVCKQIGQFFQRIHWSKNPHDLCVLYTKMFTEKIKLKKTK